MLLVTTVRVQTALLAAALVLAACATSAGRPESGSAPVETAAASAVPAPLEMPAGEPTETPAGEPFQVSSEVYSRTFEEIEALIQRLNRIVQSGDFDTWKEYLSAEYIALVSSAEYLAEQSGQPMLKDHNLRLESLRDYFEHVVVPSRSGAGMDDIEFIDEDHVKAISIIRQTRGLLYLLVREDGRWKIGIW